MAEMDRLLANIVSLSRFNDEQLGALYDGNTNRFDIAMKLIANANVSEAQQKGAQEAASGLQKLIDQAKPIDPSNYDF